MMTAVIPLQASRRQRGASLLEVLIAILIMSFGLLAMAGLTASSQQYSKMAQFQTIGSQLAIDYAERMRGNAAAFQQSLYDRTSAYSVATVAVPPCALPAQCTLAEMAARDQAEWIGELRARLPGGDGFVQRDAVNPLAADIWVMWADPSLVVGAGASDNLATTGSTDCPAAAVAAVPAGSLPRCMYYRVSI